MTPLNMEYAFLQALSLETSPSMHTHSYSPHSSQAILLNKGRKLHFLESTLGKEAFLAVCPCSCWMAENIRNRYYSPKEIDSIMRKIK